MKVALTGAAGFIGSNLAERLVARGDEVHGIDDLSHGSLENLAALAGHPRFRLAQASILDAGAMDAVAAHRTTLVVAHRLTTAARADRIVVIADGRVVVKKLYKGAKRGRWNLISTNDSPLLDQAVEWAAKVSSVRMP